jgi:hypothetical protein
LFSNSLYFVQIVAMIFSMTITEQTQVLLKQLHEFSGRRIQNGDDLACLIEIALKTNQRQLLGDIAFCSKIVWNVHSLMKRNGPESKGYGRLQIEFKENLVKVLTLIKTLINEESEKFKRRFTRRFLRMNPESIGTLLSLIYDLTWLKNWDIEHKTV